MCRRGWLICKSRIGGSYSADTKAFVRINEHSASQKRHPTLQQFGSNFVNAQRRLRRQCSVMSFSLMHPQYESI